MTIDRFHAVLSNHGWECDALGCPRLAVWAFIGEAGDLYLCEDHAGPDPQWSRIQNDERGS